MALRAGLVLAGGSGKRFGGPKGDLRWGGTTLAERAAGVLRPFCAGVLVSVGPGAASPDPRCARVEDAPPAGRGPLAGIQAGFRATGQSDLLVLACDYPRVDDAVIRRLATYAPDDDEDVVFVVDDAGRDHPLVGLWRRSAAAVIDEALSRDVRKVRAVLGDLGVRRLGGAEFPGVDLDACLLNVNWPADFERLQGNR